MSEKEKITPRLVFKDEQIEKFKSLFPETFADGKIDFDALKHALGEFIEDDSVEHFGLTWPGKRDARKMAFIPPKGTLKLAKGEGINEDTTQNLYIEGDNLEVLKLLQKSYYNKIKMIYIDPPYNTGNDFVYKDDFSQTIEDYLKETGQLSEEGKALSTNPKTSGRFHSNWLNMIYPRLVLAKTLLREDGVIFVSIDDNEVHNLRAVMNEIFGEENYLTQFAWKTDGNFDNQAKVKKCHEYIIVFCKQLENFPNPPVIDPSIDTNSKLFNDEIRNTIVKNGPKNPISEVILPKGFPSDAKEGILEIRNDQWPHYLNKAIINNFQLQNDVTIKSGWSSKDLLLDFINNENKPILDNKGQETSFIISKTGAVEIIKKRSENQSHVLSMISNLGNTQSTSSYLRSIDIYFDYPKPINLIKYFVQMNYGTDFFALDFFSGSSTTAHAILDLNKEDGGNRKFIMVQLPEATPKDSEANKAGYKTIAEIGKERIRRVIKKIHEEAVAPKEKPVKKKKQDEKLFEEGVSDDAKTDTSVDISKLDLGFKVLKLSESNIIKWPKTSFESIEQIEKQLEFSTESPLVSGYKKEDLLIEILIWEGFSLTSAISKVSIGKNTFYKVNDPSIEYSLWACFDDKLDFSMNDIKGAGFNVREAHSVGEKQETKSSNDDILVFLDKSLTDGLKSRLCDICRVKVV